MFVSTCPHDFNICYMFFLFVCLCHFQYFPYFPIREALFLIESPMQWGTLVERLWARRGALSTWKCLAPGGKNATILLAQNFQLWTCWFCIMGPPNKKWEECFAPFSPVTIPFYVIMTSLSSLKPSLDSVDSSSCWKDEYYFSRFFTRRNFQHVLIWPKGFWASPPQH